MADLICIYGAILVFKKCISIEKLSMDTQWETMAGFTTNATRCIENNEHTVSVLIRCGRLVTVHPESKQPIQPPPLHPGQREAFKSRADSTEQPI